MFHKLPGHPLPRPNWHTKLSVRGRHVGMPLRTWHLLTSCWGRHYRSQLQHFPHVYIETLYFCTTLKSEVFSIWPSFLPLFLPWPCLFCYSLKILFVGSSRRRLYLFMEGGRQRPISKVMGSCSYRDICADTYTHKCDAYIEAHIHIIYIQR